MDKYILDACALIAYYTNEKGADIVQDIISKAYFEKSYVSISKINLLEVFYDVYKTQGETEARTFLHDIVNTPADSIFLAEVIINENYIGITADHHELDVVKKKENINLLFIR